MQKSYTIDLAIFIGLLLLVLLTRTSLHIAPNVEFVTAASVFAAWVMRNKKIALAFPVAAMFVSDLVIGNSYIFLFTWSGFLFPAVLALANFSKQEETVGKKYFKFLGSGFVGVLLFYFWTNFGVVLLGNMYPNSLAGLMQSYVNALPFLRNQVLGNIFILHIFFGAYLILENVSERWTILSKLHSQST
ncbi:MAG: DUF6580 family putative transport protein [Candidatus Dojkabacteria bacterium]